MNWQEGNREYLTHAMARVGALLRRAAGQTTEPAERWDDLLSTVEAEMPAPPAVRHVSHIFGLSSFERDLLLLCAGRELEADFARLCGELQGNAQRDYPTFSLALAHLPDPHWSALIPDAPLRCWRLIEVVRERR